MEVTTIAMQVPLGRYCGIIEMNAGVNDRLNVDVFGDAHEYLKGRI